MPALEPAAQVLERIREKDGIPPVWTLLIDGGSGSGKSRLADALAAEWGAPVTVVRLDDIYPGWNGLEAASEHLRTFVLGPRSRGQEARWQRWDWSAEAPAEWTTVDPALPAIIEGSGALSKLNKPLADFSIWIELDPARRRERALARDGAAYEPYWEVWAEQERIFADRNDPRGLADLVIERS